MHRITETPGEIRGSSAEKVNDVECKDDSQCELINAERGEAEPLQLAPHSPAKRSAEPSSYQYGGKGQAGTWQRLINCMPPHRVYVECFAGSAVVARNKRAAPETVLIDASTSAIAALREGSWGAGVTIICGDAISILAAREWRGDELVYADPPYLFETRSDARTRYLCEMGAESEHCALLALLCSLPCMVVLTHYPHPLYRSSLAGWRVESYLAVTRGGTVREENIWMNFEPPAALHDYSQLGRDFRERERIRRKIARQALRLAKLPPLECAAVIAAAGEAAARRSSSPGSDERIQR